MAAHNTKPEIPLLRKDSFRQFIISGIFLISMIWVGFVPFQNEFAKIFSGITVGFFVYFFWIVQRFGGLPFRFYIGLAILIRVLLIFSFPNLSDDIYRFVWDGRITASGYNPYYYLPKDIVFQTEWTSILSTDIYAKINSPAYYTIYPPLCQIIFALPKFVGAESLSHSAMIIKLSMFLMELGSLYLLFRILNELLIPKWKLLLYALNPLILIEIMGNLHFEGMMIFFFLLFYWCFLKRKWVLSSLAVGAAIASKLLPLICLVFLIKPLKFRRSVLFFAVLALFLAIVFLPVIYGVGGINFGSSLNLYFQKFEFNGSVYYLCRWLGYQITGYNYIRVIGPGLAVISICCIIYWALRQKLNGPNSLPGLWTIAIAAYLFLATTVHPWYVSMLIALTPLTGYYFPIVWSYLIFLSYANYSYDPYEENLWIVGVEYACLGVFIWFEFRNKIVNTPKDRVRN